MTGEYKTVKRSAYKVVAAKKDSTPPNFSWIDLPDVPDVPLTRYGSVDWSIGMTV